MNGRLRNFLFGALALALVGVGVPMVQKLAAQSSSGASSSPQTRLYIPFLYQGATGGYDSFLQVMNTSMDPWGTTPSTGSSCDVYVYYAGVQYKTSLLNLTPGTLQLQQLSGILSAATSQGNTTAASALTSGGGGGYLLLNCNFPLAHAQLLQVNPNGTVVFANGFVVSPNRALITGPEQLLQ
jgi:hypothetical protein